MTHQTLTLLSLTFCLIARPGQAEASSARQLVNQGNEAYRAGKYADALAAYEKAAVSAKESALISFNQGDAHYQMGDYAQAAAAFERAAAKSHDPSLMSRIQFNLGDCSLREAERQRAEDLEKAVASCEKSIRHFQEALALDSGFKEAAENIEIARLYLKTLRDEVEKRGEERRRQEEQARRQDAQPSSSQQDSSLAGDQSSQSAAGNRSSAAAKAGQTQAGPDRPSQSSAQSQMESALEQLRQRQQHAFQRQLQSGSQWGQQQSFSFQSTFIPVPNRSLGQRPSQEPLTDQPQNILNEEKENRSQRNRFTTPAADHPVDKDW